MYLSDQFVHNQLEATRVLERYVDGEMSGKGACVLETNAYMDGR